MSAHSLMFNWIGRMPDRDRAMSVPGVHWHDYGKEPRPGRKIGHATLTAATADELKKNASKVADIAGGDFPRLFGKLLFQN
jgi:5-(carboxyamino)imidazole ribonucleotide synthase